MKIAAVKAIANLAKEVVPEEVLLAYDESSLSFGPNYIIPKPNDPRLISTVSPAVAKAAIQSGVSEIKEMNWEKYINTLNERLGIGSKLIRNITKIAKSNKKYIVFPEASNIKVLKAVQIIKDEDICVPILLGNEDHIQKLINDNGLELEGLEIINPKTIQSENKIELFANNYWKSRSRHGITKNEALRKMKDRNYFGCMMVTEGLADGMVSGVTRSYPETLKPALEIIGMQKNVKRVAGLYVTLTKRGPIFFSDTTMNKKPTEDELIEIILLTAKEVRRFGIKPVIALLSYSNFGSTKDLESKKLQNVIRYFHSKHPNLLIDGEFQANFALNKQKMKEQFPYSKLIDKNVNTLIFPNLESGNISYKLLQELSNFDTIGPILMGLNKSVHIVQLESSVNEIVNITRIAAAGAQTKKQKL